MLPLYGHKRVHLFFVEVGLSTNVFKALTCALCLQNMVLDLFFEWKISSQN